MKYLGIVSAFFPSRKFGFILLDGSTSRFFHLSISTARRLSVNELNLNSATPLG
jgi:hypothetical protein